MRAMIVALGLAAGLFGTAGEALAQRGYHHGGHYPRAYGYGGYGYRGLPYYSRGYYAAPVYGYPAVGWPAYRSFGYGTGFGFPAYGYGWPAYGGYGSGFRLSFGSGGFW